MDRLPHPSVADRLSRLAPDQRAAATMPPGPLLVVAPAGSGKTTTLVARVAWLVDGGTDPGTVTVLAFNKRASDELVERIDAALAPLGCAPGVVRVRTFHALGREILRDGGVSVEPLLDRDELLRDLFPGMTRADRGRLDIAFSRLKLDLRVRAEDVAEDPAAGPVARAYVAYERAVRDSGGVDFDDLVVRALDRLASDERLLARWRARTSTLLVDEAQDLDRTQLDLALVLAGPGRNLCAVGDDDQSIYGWRLADVRRVLGLAADLPGIRRVDLATNYRCPRPVVERAVRLVEQNHERFAKRIRARDGAVGRLVLAPDASDDEDRARHVFAAWSLDGTAGPDAGAPSHAGPRRTRAILARTNRELLPAAAVALELGIPFRADRLALLLDDPRLDALLADIERPAPPGPIGPGGLGGPDSPVDHDDMPLLVRIARLRGLGAETGTLALAADLHAEPHDATAGLDRDPPPELVPLAELVEALLAWAAPFRTAAAFVATVRARRDALAILRRADADLTLATAHSTKGLEFDDVAVVDMDADRFPSRRSLDDAPDPVRALEEERRLAYVAWTRALRSLTLVFDPAAPSRFMLEAFEPTELGG